MIRLAEVETAFGLEELPSAIAVICRDDAARARTAEDLCLRLLEAQGPFFPKVVALETLGELRAVHFIPEIMEYLSDENSYVYGAAERALAKSSQFASALLLGAGVGRWRVCIEGESAEESPYVVMTTNLIAA